MPIAPTDPLPGDSDRSDVPTDTMTVACGDLGRHDLCDGEATTGDFADGPTVPCACPCHLPSPEEDESL